MDIRRALDEARQQPGFLDRIAERVKEDVAVLDALAESERADRYDDEPTVELKPKRRPIQSIDEWGVSDV